MPRRSKHPKPVKRFKDGAWVILWRFSPEPKKYVQYSVSTGLNREKDDEIMAEVILRQFAAALASEAPAFPAEYANAPGAMRYLEDCSGQPGRRRADAKLWLADYERHIKSECVERWAIVSLNTVKALDAATHGGVAKVASIDAQQFLDGILRKGLTPATRNRALAACSRFFNWAVQTGRATVNPFKGIKSLKEADAEEIVYCTREERNHLIALAKELKAPDWLAVPIAFYAGLRREEIFNMTWKDVLFDEGRIVVPKSKTKKRRVLPLSKSLRLLLESVAPTKRRGYVVTTPNPDASRLHRADELVDALRRRMTPKAKKQGKNANTTEDEEGGPNIPKERIRWNAWRHTFGSLLAQDGVSLDKISAWMGNTPEVCRRHYAQFVPRDRHDEDIEKLG